jgi:hypothetical protein
MSTLSGTINGISLVGAPDTVGARKIYELACSFTQNFTAGDIAQLVSVDTAVRDAVKNGKTFTVLATALGAGLSFRPGIDSSNGTVYPMGPFTNTSGTLTFGVGSSSTNAACTAPGANSPMRILVIGDES